MKDFWEFAIIVHIGKNKMKLPKNSGKTKSSMLLRIF